MITEEFEAALVEMMIRHRNRQTSGEPDGKSHRDLSLFVDRYSYSPRAHRDIGHRPPEPAQEGRVFGRGQLDV